MNENTSNENKTWVCPVCSNEMPENSEFCNKCGHYRNNSDKAVKKSPEASGNAKANTTAGSYYENLHKKLAEEIPSNKFNSKCSSNDAKIYVKRRILYGLITYLICRVLFILLPKLVKANFKLNPLEWKLILITEAITLLIVAIIVVAIFIHYYITKQFYLVACEKGYPQRRFFWIPFFWVLIGHLLIIALPDRGKKE